jgi:hypothetical protein
MSFQVLHLETFCNQSSFNMDFLFKTNQYFCHMKTGKNSELTATYTFMAHFDISFQ